MNRYLANLFRAARTMRPVAGMRIVRGRITRAVQMKNGCHLKTDLYEFQVTDLFVNGSFQSANFFDPENEIVLVVDKKSNFARLPHFSKHFTSTLLLGSLEGKICDCKNSSRCRLERPQKKYWRVLLPIFCRRQAVSRSLLIFLQDLQMSSGDFWKLDKAMCRSLEPWLKKRNFKPINKEILWHLSSDEKKADFDCGTYSTVVNYLYPLVSENIDEESVGLVSVIFGLSVYDMPVTGSKSDYVHNLVRRLCLTRLNLSDPVDCNFLIQFLGLKKYQKALLYPVIYRLEDKAKLGNVPWAIYLQLLEARKKYLRHVLNFDRPMISAEIEFVKIFSRCPEKIQPHILVRNSCERLASELNSTRVRIIGAVHLPSQIKSVVRADYQSDFLICPNRGLQLWLMRILAPIIPYRFEDVKSDFSGPQAHRPRRVVVLWAHQLGFQHWLDIVETFFPSSEIVFVCSIFGTHVRTPVVTIPKMPLDASGYGVGCVWSQVQRHLQKKVEVVEKFDESQYGGSHLIPQAYRLCYEVYQVVNRKNQFFEALPKILALLQEPRELESCAPVPGVGQGHFGNSTFTLHLSPKYSDPEQVAQKKITTSFLGQSSGEVFFHAPNDAETAVHICRCYFLGVEFCEPDYRYRELFSHAAPRPDRAKMQIGCMKSRKANVAQHNHVLLDLSAEPGQALPYMYYSGFPADEVIAEVEDKKMSLLQLAQLATFSSEKISISEIFLRDSFIELQNSPEWPEAVDASRNCSAGFFEP